MHCEPVRLRAIPTREGVGRESTVHQRDMRREGRVGQVLVVAVQLPRRELTLNPRKP